MQFFDLRLEFGNSETSIELRHGYDYYLPEKDGWKTLTLKDLEEDIIIHFAEEFKREVKLEILNIIKPLIENIGIDISYRVRKHIT